MNRISIFIDGNNFYHSLRKIYGDSKDLIRFNFDRFVRYIAKDKEIISIFYYNAPLDRTKNLEKYKSQQRFFENLKKIPKFKLILCKLVKRKIKRTGGVYYTIKEDDIHMAVDMVEGASDDKFDTAIIVSGDGDFVPAVKAIQRKGKKVENVYFKNSYSINLKNNCDRYLILKKEILDQFFT
ncbi:MAG: NYN domain-containing protein [archaeon]